MATGIETEHDGYFHPATQLELRALVERAHREGLPLRVKGSGHSLANAIYTSGFDGAGKPPTGVIEVMLDRYRQVTITPDPDHPGSALVDVEAGCNLGKDPHDPTGTSTWANSLNFKLQKAGYALEDLGGISHQTISGFMSTGSSGGSLTYSFERNLVGLTLIDGTGQIHELRRDDPDPEKRDMFLAAGVSMGLLGVISTVRLRVGPDYNIQGLQVTGPTASAGIDCFGAGTGDPTFEDYLRQTPYTRLMWWPQSGLDQMVNWQAIRTAPTPGFKPQPYEELGKNEQLMSLLGSLVCAVLGNLADLSKLPPKLQLWFKHLFGDLVGAPGENACLTPRITASAQAHTVDDVLGKLEEVLTHAFAAQNPLHLEGMTRLRALELVAFAAAGGAGIDLARGLPPAVARAITAIVRRLLTDAAESPILDLLGKVLNDLLPYCIGALLQPFVSSGVQYFWDSWRCGLPMDNQMDDDLWPTEFTELWIPVDRADEVMAKLQTFFKAGGDPRAAYQHTGRFSVELYGTAASEFWMSPAYGTPVVRIDLLWFRLNAEDPRVFYQQFWDLLRGFNYRPHWGKYLPAPEYYVENLPNLDAFRRLRSALDPRGIFLSDYWRKQLGIVELPVAAR